MIENAASVHSAEFTLLKSPQNMWENGMCMGIHGVFPPGDQHSQDRLHTHSDPDQDKAVTKDE